MSHERKSDAASDPSGEVLREIVFRYLQRRESGESSSIATEIIQQHPELAELEDEIRKADAILQLGADAFADVSPEATLSVGSDSADVASRPYRRPNVEGFVADELIGVGAFGVVWKARDLRLDREVAIKVPRNPVLDADERSKFLKEARSAAQLKHPNIIAVHETSNPQDELVYIVSDYVDGMTLSEKISEGRLEVRVAAELCRKIALALAHAHNSGVIHRDLKPSNVLLDDTLEPHITDFGLAKREATDAVDRTVDGQILGTPAYMSPEQARGESRTVDPTSDIYSLGVMLYQMLTGSLPFRGSTRVLLSKVLYEEARSPRALVRSLPRDIETICLRCLEKDSTKRYPTAEELADDLARFLSFEPIKARPISGFEKFRRWSYRNRRQIIAASIALLIGVVLPVVGSRLARRYRNLNQYSLSVDSRTGGTLVADLMQEGKSIDSFTVPTDSGHVVPHGEYTLRVRSGGRFSLDEAYQILLPQRASKVEFLKSGFDNDIGHYSRTQKVVVGENNSVWGRMRRIHGRLFHVDGRTDVLSISDRSIIRYAGYDLRELWYCSLDGEAEQILDDAGFNKMWLTAERDGHMRSCSATPIPDITGDANQDVLIHCRENFHGSLALLALNGATGKLKWCAKLEGKRYRAFVRATRKQSGRLEVDRLDSETLLLSRGEVSLFVDSETGEFKKFGSRPRNSQQNNGSAAQADTSQEPTATEEERIRAFVKRHPFSRKREDRESQSLAASKGAKARTSGRWWSDVRIADFNNDGLDDLCVGLRPIRSIRGRPERLWRRTDDLTVVADLNGDGFREMRGGVGTDPFLRGAFRIIDGKTGSLICSRRKRPQFAGALPDLDGDGVLDQALVNSEQIRAVSTATGEVIWSKNIKVDTNDIPSSLFTWKPLDADHACIALSLLTGCRLFDMHGHEVQTDLPLATRMISRLSDWTKPPPRFLVYLGQRDAVCYDLQLNRVSWRSDHYEDGIENDTYRIVEFDGEPHVVENLEPRKDAKTSVRSRLIRLVDGESVAELPSATSLGKLGTEYVLVDRDDEDWNVFKLDGQKVGAFSMVEAWEKERRGRSQRSRESVNLCPIGTLPLHIEDQTRFVVLPPADYRRGPGPFEFVWKWPARYDEFQKPRDVKSGIISMFNKQGPQGGGTAVVWFGSDIYGIDLSTGNAKWRCDYPRAHRNINPSRGPRVAVLTPGRVHASPALCFHGPGGAVCVQSLPTSHNGRFLAN